MRSKDIVVNLNWIYIKILSTYMSKCIQIPLADIQFFKLRSRRNMYIHVPYMLSVTDVAAGDKAPHQQEQCWF